MKPSTQGFLLGLVAGAILMLALQIFGLMALGFFFGSGPGKSWIADRTLREPRYPAADAVHAISAADYGWSMQTLDGEVVSFAEFEGKTVFLNVWATWCGPCVMEMPSLEKLYREVGDEVAFVVVSKEDADAVRSFREREALTMPLYVVDALPAAFDSRTVPTTYILDRSGDVVFQHRGAARWDGEGSKAFLASLYAP